VAWHQRRLTPIVRTQVPSSFSHIVAGIALGTPVLPQPISRRYWACAGFCAAIVDIDWLWSFRGRPYEHWLEHRGLTHSLLFAAALAAVVAWLILHPVAPQGTLGRLWGGLTLATASHGFFDAMSTYGAGVAFLLPFSTRRFFFPWRPISGNTSFGVGLAQKLLVVFGREVLWVWLPSLLVAFVVWRLRRRANA